MAFEDLERGLPIVSARAPSTARTQDSPRRITTSDGANEKAASQRIDKRLQWVRAPKRHAVDPAAATPGPWWRRTLRRLTHASTGSPSDIGSSEASASVHAVLAPAQTHDSLDDVVDVIVVQGDQDTSQHAGRPGLSATHTVTASETCLDSSGASLHGSIRYQYQTTNDDPNASVIWRLIRYRAWPLFAYFVAPKFEPAEREDEFVKIWWYQRKSTGFWCALPSARPDAAGSRSSWQAHRLARLLTM